VVGVPAADPRGCRRSAAKMNPSPALAEGFPFARNLVAAARRAECRWAIARPLKTARAMARTHRSHLLHLLHAVAIAPAHLRPALHDLGRGVRRPARLWGSGTSRLDGTRLAWRLHLGHAGRVAPGRSGRVAIERWVYPDCGSLNRPVDGGGPPLDCRLWRKCASRRIKGVSRAMCPFNSWLWLSASRSTSR
jgi:hypothetical protein